MWQIYSDGTNNNIRKSRSMDIKNSGKYRVNNAQPDNIHSSKIATCHRLSFSQLDMPFSLNSSISVFIFLKLFFYTFVNYIV